ncbi:hypothetical protein FQR65_LT07385 [Abscondita terminalis]|nr:hypothetical protein FQR65_LT07385 [Abscondita terminalis]
MNNNVRTLWTVFKCAHFSKKQNIERLVEKSKPVYDILKKSKMKDLHLIETAGCKENKREATEKPRGTGALFDEHIDKSRPGQVFRARKPNVSTILRLAWTSFRARKPNVSTITLSEWTNENSRQISTRTNTREAGDDVKLSHCL